MSPLQDISAHKAEILHLILRIHIFTLLRLYRRHPNEISKPFIPFHALTKEQHTPELTQRVNSLRP